MVSLFHILMRTIRRLEMTVAGLFAFWTFWFLF